MITVPVRKDTGGNSVILVKYSPVTRINCISPLGEGEMEIFLLIQTWILCL